MPIWHEQFATHKEIILLARAMAYLSSTYPIAAQGQCYGLQQLAGCAILSGPESLFSFNNRLCFIKSLFNSENPVEDLNFRLSALEEDKILDLHYFFNTVIISQMPLNHLSSLTLDTKEYDRNHYLPIIETESLKVEKQGGLHNILVVTGLFLLKEIELYVQCLGNALKKYWDKSFDKRHKRNKNFPFFITLAKYYPSKGHAMVLGYYPSAGKNYRGSWFVYDANIGPIHQIRFYKMLYLANFIKACFYDSQAQNEYISIDSVLYCFGNHKKQAKRLATILEKNLIKLEFTKLMDEKGSFRKTATGNSLLHYAAIIGNIKFFIALLDKFQNEINDKDHKQCTPLMFAAKRGRNEIVSFLIESGADIHMLQNQGKCALELAAERGEIETVNILLNQYQKEKPKQSDTIFKLLHQNNQNTYFILSKILEKNIKKNIFFLVINFFFENKNTIPLDNSIKNIFQKNYPFCFRKPH